MNKCSKFVSLCNPCANYDALENFKTLQTRKQIAIGAITGVVAVLTLPVFGLLGVLTFRCLVKKFSAKKIELDGEDKKVQNIVQEKMDPAQKLELLKQRKASLLIHAIVENNIEKVKGLLNEADIPDSEGYLPFHWAIQEGHLEIVELLMDKVKPEAINAEISKGKGIYPLTLCVRENHPHIAKYLLEHGANPDIPYNNKSIWLAVAETGQLELVKILMEKRSAQEKWEALSYAAEKGKIDVMEYLLDSGAAAPNIDDELNMWAEDDNKELIIWTNLTNAPLLRAAQVGNVESVEFLLKKNPELLNYKMNNQIFGFTVLTHAAKHGKTNVVKYLLQQGADPSIPDPANSLPLHHAADKGHLEIAKMLIEKKADSINVKGHQRATPLCVASRAGNLDMVQFLLNSGADATIHDGNGYLPLHWATQNKHLEIVKTLVDKNLNLVNAKGPGGNTALNISAIEGVVNIAQYLLDHGADLNISNDAVSLPLHNASFGGHVKIVELLHKDKNFNINAKGTPFQATALSIGAYKGHLNIVKYLADNGADINMPAAADGNLPIQYAAFLGHFDILKYLLGIAKNVNSKNAKNITILMCASSGLDKQDPQFKDYEANKINIVKYLVDQGADITLRDHKGSPALHYAAYAGYLDIVKLFLESNPELLNAPNLQGKTVLHKATKMGRTEVVKYLLSKGADRNIQDARGRTAKQIGEKQGFKEIVGILDQP